MGEPDFRESDMDYLTVQEYAERFRLHVQTVYSAIRYNRLRFSVIRAAGRSIRIAVPRESINLHTNAHAR